MRPSAFDGSILAWRRIAGGRWLLLLLVPTLFVGAIALAERSGGAAATDRTLTGATFGIAIPLVALALWRLVAPGLRLDDALLPLSRRGADRRVAALGLLATLSILAAAAGTFLASVAVLATRGLADPRLTSDLTASAWIGAVAGAAYACWLGLGTSFGARGGGRWALLLLDAALGTGTGPIAFPWPRAHLRNLLGADAVLGLPQWTAVPWLGVLLTFCALGLLARTDR